ncbi:6240_t:CDS:2, partial [Acaulospora morrowiae]
RHTPTMSNEERITTWLSNYGKDNNLSKEWAPIDKYLKDSHEIVDLTCYEVSGNDDSSTSKKMLDNTARYINGLQFLNGLRNVQIISVLMILEIHRLRVRTHILFFHKRQYTRKLFVTIPQSSSEFFHHPKTHSFSASRSVEDFLILRGKISGKRQEIEPSKLKFSIINNDGSMTKDIIDKLPMPMNVHKYIISFRILANRKLEFVERDFDLYYLISNPT